MYEGNTKWHSVPFFELHFPPQLQIGQGYLKNKQDNSVTVSSNGSTIRCQHLSCSLSKSHLDNGFEEKCHDKQRRFPTERVSDAHQLWKRLGAFSKARSLIIHHRAAFLGASRTDLPSALYCLSLCSFCSVQCRCILRRTFQLVILSFRIVISISGQLRRNPAAELLLPVQTTGTAQSYHWGVSACQAGKQNHILSTC